MWHGFKDSWPDILLYSVLLGGIYVMFYRGLVIGGILYSGITLVFVKVHIGTIIRHRKEMSEDTIREVMEQ